MKQPINQLKSLEVQLLEANTKLDIVKSETDRVKKLNDEYTQKIKDYKEKEKEYKVMLSTMQNMEVDVKSRNARIEVLDNQIADKKQQLNSVEYSFMDTVKEQDLKIKEINDRIKELKSEIKSRTNSITKLKEVQSDLRQTNTTLKDEIDERTKYMAEQEKLIEETITSGNNRLQDIKYDILDAEELKEKSINDRVQTENELNDFIVKYLDKKNYYNDELARIILNTENAQASFDKLVKDTQMYSERSKQITKDHETRMKALKEEETRIMAIREACRLEQEQLQTDKRRWASTKALYNIEDVV